MWMFPKRMEERLRGMYVNPNHFASLQWRTVCVYAVLRSWSCGPELCWSDQQRLERGTREGWYSHSYLQDVQFILGKNTHTHFKIPSHSLFNGAPFQIPRQSQFPHRLLEIRTFPLSHDNSSHERASLGSHVLPCTLSSGLCIHHQAPWIYLKKDCECCIPDKGFGNIHM